MRSDISKSWEDDPCEICKMSNQKSSTDGDFFSHFDCERCGTYTLPNESSNQIRNLTKNNKTLLSGWIREQNNAGLDFVKLDKITLEAVLTQGIPDYQTRFNNLLSYLVKKCPELGTPIELDMAEMTAVTYSKNDAEVGYFIQHMIDEKIISTAPNKILLKPLAFQKIVNIIEDKSISKQIFVAMSFDPALDEVYKNGIYKAITNIGYKPLRVDKTEHTNRIDDEILRQISTSKLVVADFTDHKPGVYFEAGYALALGKKVIWTCREDHREKLHFDIRQYNCLFWDSIPEFCKKLESRISANIT
jgi:hypothetical protein